MAQSDQPKKSIDVGDLTEAVTAAVHQALSQREASASAAELPWPIRVIVGIILEPTNPPGPPS
jgi:hypothetical protein